LHEKVPSKRQVPKRILKASEMEETVH